MMIMAISGTDFNYFHICHRKLWLNHHSISMEQNNENVKIGRFLSDTTYTRKIHEIAIDNISIDFFDEKRKVIHEIKKSNKLEPGHIWQVKYYLFILKQKGVMEVTGLIDYPNLKKRIQVALCDEDVVEINKIIPKIESLVKSSIIPEVINEPFCKSCSYFDLCYI